MMGFFSISIVNFYSAARVSSKDEKEKIQRDGKRDGVMKKEKINK